MDTLPTELLYKITEYSSFLQLKELRIVNSEWATISNELLRKLTRIQFFTPKGLTKFNHMFSSTVDMPSTRYYFHFEALNASDPTTIQEFSEKYGETVSELQLGGGIGSHLNENFETNTRLLLGYVAKTLLEVTLYPPTDKAPTDLPWFPKLRTVNLHLKGSTGSNLLNFFTELAQRIPSVTSITLTAFLRVEDEELQLPSILKTFANNSLISFHLCNITLNNSLIPAMPQLLDLPLPNIRELELTIPAYPQVFIEGQSVSVRLSKWLALHRNSLRKLNISSSIKAYSIQKIDLPIMPNLEELEFSLLIFNTLFPKQFPRLKTLRMNINDVSTFGAPVPTVRILHLHGNKRLPFEEYYQEEALVTFPSIDTLSMDNMDQYSKLAFKFKKLVRLNIGPDCDVDWNLLTGRTYPFHMLLYKDICTVPLPPPPPTEVKGYDENHIHSLSDLKELQYLEIQVKSNNLETVQAIIFLSRCGRLHRLKELIFNIYDECPTNYVDVLKLHHDRVTYIAQYVPTMN